MEAKEPPHVWAQQPQELCRTNPSPLRDSSRGFSLTWEVPGTPSVLAGLLGADSGTGSGVKEMSLLNFHHQESLS